MKKAFPDLPDDDFTVTSPATPDYNCIAWAADISHVKWWPVQGVIGCEWPDEAPLETTLEAFLAAYGTKGYKRCRDGKQEIGFDKIVLYINPDNGEPTHAAKQLPDGSWTSKLGNGVDINHRTPEGLSGKAYGQVAAYMRSQVLPWPEILKARIKALLRK